MTPLNDIANQRAPCKYRQKEPQAEKEIIPIENVAVDINSISVGLTGVMMMALMWAFPRALALWIQELTEAAALCFKVGVAFGGNASAVGCINSKIICVSVVLSVEVVIIVDEGTAATGNLQSRSKSLNI